MPKASTGWRRVRFGQVVQLNKETSRDPAADALDRYVGLEHIEPSDLRIRSWGDIAEGTTFTNRFRPGHVLFGKRRAYQRKVAVADFGGVCSGDIYVLESSDPSMLMPELLPFICQTDPFFEHAVGTSAGSLSPRTNWKNLAEFELHLPPVSEQARILQPLKASAENVDSLIEGVAKGRTALRAVRRSVFEQRPARCRTRLRDAVLSSAYGPRFSAKNYDPSGNVWTIRTTDMPEFGVITPETVPRARIPKKTADDHELREGDFLMSRTGFTSGRAAVFRINSGDGVYVPAAFLIRLRLKTDRLIPEYLLEFLQSPDGQRLIQRLQRGTQQLNISASALQEQQVPMPPVAEQQYALEQIDSTAQPIAAIARRLEEAHALHQRVVNQILLGAP